MQPSHQTLSVYWSVLNKRGQTHQSLPCLYGKLPPAVSAALPCGSADRDPEREPPKAALLHSHGLDPDIQESTTGGGTKRPSGNEDVSDVSDVSP